MGRTLASASLTLSAMVLLSGCGSMHLYSETRDKQGQAAVKAWKEVSFTDFFAAERANRAKLLDEELQASKELFASDRELEIVKLVSGVPISEYPATFNLRLTNLAGTNGLDIAAKKVVIEAISALSDRKVNEAQRDRDQTFLTQADGPVLRCDDIADQSKGALSVWREAHSEPNSSIDERIDAMGTSCTKIKENEKTYADAIAKLSTTGELGLAIRSLAGARKRLQDKRDALAIQQGIYAQALKEYKAELALKASGKSIADRVTAAALKVETAVKAIEGLQNAVGDEFLSKERIDRLNALLGEVRAGNRPAEDASKAEVAVLLLPKIANDIRAVSNADKGANVLPLLIKRDIEQARVKAAQVETSMVDAEIALRQSALESRLAEALLIFNASAAYDRHKAKFQTLGCEAEDPAAKAPVCRFDVNWKKLEPKEKLALLEATGQYLDSYGRQRSLTKRLDRLRTAVAQQRASNLSEVNTGMWASLIDATVTQAADFATLGWKASDFARIFELVGIAGIAHGTNK